MKKFIFFVLLLFIYSSVFAQSKRIAIFNPQTEGLSKEDEVWVPSSVRRKLESNFNLYTSFQLVEIQNEAEIKILQKKADGSAYDSDTSIELGKLVSAEYGVFSTITNVKGKYILSSSITNLSTGIRLSSVATDSVDDVIDLFEGAGCSANQITVQFCMDLNIPLSSVDVHKLLKEQNVSNSQEMDLMEEELSRYDAYKKELESKIKEMNLSVELGKDSIKAKLEAEKAMIEQQEKIAKERLERLKKENEQYLKDVEDEKLRSQEQISKINQAQKEIESKVEELRKKNMNNLSVDEQIAIIEAKKVALVELRESINTQIDYLNQNAQDEYERRIAYIDEEPLRKGELDSNGNIISSVKAKRDAEKKKIKNEIFSQTEKEIDEIVSKTSIQEKSLLAAIEEDYKTLSKKKTISSLQDDRIFFVENYAGEKYQWNVLVSLFINDSAVFAQNIGLNYKNVTGKVEASPYDSDKWNDYLDTVDLYDYMFRRKVPVISVEIDYTVEPMSEDYPSCYLITIEQFRFIDTRTNKVVQLTTPPKRLFRLNVTPAVDLRTGKKSSSIKDSYYSKSTTVEEELEKLDKKEETKTKKEKNKIDPRYDQSNFGGSKLNLGFGFGGFTSIEETHDLQFIQLYCDFPLSTYSFCRLNMILDTDSLEYVSDFDDSYIDSAYSNYTIGYGINRRLRLGNYYPNFYSYVGIGFEALNLNDYSDEDIGFVFAGALGIDLPFAYLFAVSMEYGYIYTSHYDWNQMITFDISIAL